MEKVRNVYRVDGMLIDLDQIVAVSDVVGYQNDFSNHWRMWGFAVSTADNPTTKIYFHTEQDKACAESAKVRERFREHLKREGEAPYVGMFCDMAAVGEHKLKLIELRKDPLFVRGEDDYAAAYSLIDDNQRLDAEALRDEFIAAWKQAA